MLPSISRVSPLGNTKNLSCNYQHEMMNYPQQYKLQCSYHYENSTNLLYQIIFHSQYTPLLKSEVAL